MSDRRARVRTVHTDPETVAAALRPDDTPSMTTRAVDGAVVTELARDETGGLRSTVDDYLVNLRVADRLVRAADALDDVHDEGPDAGTAPDGDASTTPPRGDTGIAPDEHTPNTTDTHDT